MRSDGFYVSVVIPVYNGESFLAEAVRSIQEQNHKLLEIIVVDDGSVDGTARLAAELDVRYSYQVNRGLPAARNRGLELSRGDVITFLDVDDLWSRNKLRLQLAHLSENTATEIILGYTQLVQVLGFENGAHVSKEWSAPTLAMSMGAASFRRSVFDKIGLFDETQRYCDDLDWFMRARERGVSLLIHPQVTLYYRRHQNNMTNQIELGNQGMLRMLKKSLDRRRQEGRPAKSLERLSAGQPPDRRKS